MKSLIAAAIVLGIGCAPSMADDALMLNQPMPNSPVPAAGLGSDIFAILVSDTTFGPSQQDADIAARFYCSTRGKLTTFVGKQHPPEMHTTVFQEWSVLTYRCITAVTSAPQVGAPTPAQ